MTDQEQLPPLWVGLFRLGLRILVIAIAVFAIHLMTDWATSRAEAAGRDGLMLGLLSALLLAYAFLMAIPFMPGIEIGISLLVLKGASIAPLVYAATVLGLALALLAGRFMPYRWLHGFLADLRLRRAAALVERLAPMSREERLEHYAATVLGLALALLAWRFMPYRWLHGFLAVLGLRRAAGLMERLAPMSREERLEYLAKRAPRWLQPIVRTGRYLLLAVLLNVPGNAVIGGGGGIAFVAGFSRLFRPSIAILVIALAVLPVPLTVWIAGTGSLPSP